MNRLTVLPFGIALAGIGLVYLGVSYGWIGIAIAVIYAIVKFRLRSMSLRNEVQTQTVNPLDSKKRGQPYVEQVITPEAQGPKLQRVGLDDVTDLTDQGKPYELHIDTNAVAQQGMQVTFAYYADRVLAQLQKLLKSGSITPQTADELIAKMAKTAPEVPTSSDEENVTKDRFGRPVKQKLYALEAGYKKGRTGKDLYGTRQKRGWFF